MPPYANNKLVSLQLMSLIIALGIIEVNIILFLMIFCYAENTVFMPLALLHVSKIVTVLSNFSSKVSNFKLKVSNKF